VDHDVGQLEVDHAIDVVALQEELRLAGVAGEPVDDEAVVPVVHRQPVAHHRLDQLVIDELAGGHDPADVSAELGVPLHVPAEEVPDAQVDEVEVVGQQPRLRALAAALDAHDDELAHGASLADLGEAAVRAPGAPRQRVLRTRGRAGSARQSVSGPGWSTREVAESLVKRKVPSLVRRGSRGRRVEGGDPVPRKLVRAQREVVPGEPLQRIPPRTAGPRRSARDHPCKSSPSTEADGDRAASA